MTATNKGRIARTYFTRLAIPAAALLAGCSAQWSNGMDPDSADFEVDLVGDNQQTDDGQDSADDQYTGLDAQVLSGFVHDPFGLALEGVSVNTLGGSTAVSDASGRFALPDMQPGQRIVMSFSKDGYATTQGSVVATDGGVNFFSQTMARVDLTIDFVADEGAEFEIDGTHAFDLPANTILSEDGEPYDGNVHLQATVWDRTKALDEGGEFLASPGNGRGIDSNGDEWLLYSFGMFQLEMTDDEGEPLQAGPGISMVIDVPENSNFQVGESVPYWDYDASQQTWVEEDAGRIAELGSGQQVWEFEPTQGLPLRNTTTEWRRIVTGNPDYPIYLWIQAEVSAQATGTVTNQQGQPLVGASVRIVASDQTYMIPTQTDALGTFSVQVPPAVSNPAGPNGRPLFVEVDYEAANEPKLWRNDPIPAPGSGGLANFGDLPMGSVTCLSGTVVDSAGQAVAGLSIATPHAGNAVTDSNGGFCTTVSMWQPTTVYAVSPPGSPQGFVPAPFRPKEANQGGDCAMGCPNVVQLTAYGATSCASGEVLIGEFEADGMLVEAFDNRFPGAPIFSTHTSSGQYCVSVPVGIDTTIRVGAGDNTASNACASHSINATEANDTCDDGWCEEIPAFDCGE